MLNHITKKFAYPVENIKFEYRARKGMSTKIYPSCIIRGAQRGKGGIGAHKIASESDRQDPSGERSIYGSNNSVSAHSMLKTIC